MQISTEIKSDFLTAGADPEIAEYVSMVSATLLLDAESFYKSFPDYLVGMLEASPLGDLAPFIRLLMFKRGRRISQLPSCNRSSRRFG